MRFMQAGPWRWFRHWWHDEPEARRVLGESGLARIAAQVAESERHHSGEIRVCIESGLPFAELWRGVSARERALALFGQLRVWDTEANNGVLIYLLLAERAIELVADRGVVRRVPGDIWQGLVEDMQQAFRDGDFQRGLDQALRHIDTVLREHFPVAEGTSNPNELPDHPAIS